MHPFLRTRVCRVVSFLTALTLATTTIMSTVPAAFAAGTVSSSPPIDITVAQGPILVDPNSPQSAAPTVVRELTDEAGVSSRQYLLSNGNIRVEYYSEPINYTDRQTGELKPIDPGLQDAVISSREVSTNKANGFRLQLPHTLSGDWASIETSAGKVGFRPALRAASRDIALVPQDGIVASSRTTTSVAYADAFTGATLEYVSRPDGLKETIAVSAPSSSTVYSFDLSLSGLTPKLQHDGSISLFSGKRTTAAMTIPRPVMSDSSPDGGQYVGAAHYKLSGAGPVYRLDVVADAAWLSDPARVYPVMIDPTVETTGTTVETYVESGSPTSSWYNAPCFDVNEQNEAGGTWLAYAQPGTDVVSDMAAKKAAGYSVVAAWFGANELGAYGTTATVKASMCTSSVAIPTVTWNSRPATTTAYQTSAVRLWNASISAWSDTWDLTGMFAGWQQQGVPVGMCTAEFSTSAGSSVHFWDQNQSSLIAPVYTIDYAGLPTVTLTSPSAGSQVCTTQATWTYQEAATGFPQARYRIEVATSTTGPSIASTEVASSSTSGPLPVPAGGWVDWQRYYVHVQVASSPSTATPLLWSSWSAWGDCFATATPDAIPPATTSDVQPAYSGAATITLTATDNAGGSGVAATYWVLDGSAQTTGTSLVVPSLVTTVAFGYTGSDQTFVIPAGVTAVSVTIAGAGGGGGGGDWDGEDGGQRGANGCGGNQSSVTCNGVTYSAYGGGGGSSGYYGGGTGAAGGTSMPRNWMSTTGGGALGGGPGQDTYCGGSGGSGGELSNAGLSVAAGQTITLRIGCGGAGGADADPDYPWGNGNPGNDGTVVLAYTTGTASHAISFWSVDNAGNVEAANSATFTVSSPTAEPRHTTFDLGTIGTADGQARLDEGSLTLAATDLSIDSYGPDVSLSRRYDSSNATPSIFGPGWRFDFERSLSIDATGATYVDETGDAHRFTLTGSGYLSPWGDHESLSATSASTVNGQAGFEMLHDDRRSYALFSSTGTLLSETDNNGMTVDYKITPSEVDITAANELQAIVMSINGNGTAVANYCAGTVTRQVAYSYTGDSSVGTGTATYTYSDSSTSTPTPGHTETYVYANSHLTRVIESQAASIALQSGSSATWDVAYKTGSMLSTITAPYYKAAQRAVTTIGYGVDSSSLADATVTQSGEVSGTVRSVYQTFGINPSGTMAYRTNDYTDGVSTPPTWGYAYSPTGETIAETNPDGGVKSCTYDSLGDVLSETDELGHTTTNCYDTFGDLIQSTDAAGATTFYAYDSRGNQSNVRRPTATFPGSTSTTTTYDAWGRIGDEMTVLSEDASATGMTPRWHYIETSYVYSGSGPGLAEPGQTLRVPRVELADGEWGIDSLDLGSGPRDGGWFTSAQATFDAAGNVLTSTDASGTQTTNSYDAAGRLLSSRSPDPGGALTVHVFDGLGREVADYQTDGTSIVGYTRADIDPFGNTVAQSSYLTTTALSTAVLSSVVTRTCDAMGRETSESDSAVAGQPAITTHDAAGNAVCSWPAGLSATQTADVRFATQTRYDAEGRDTSECAAGASAAASTKTYNADGTVVSETDPDQTTTTYLYDGAGRVTTQTESAATGVTTTRNAYDSGGRLVKSWDENGTETDYTYDLGDRQTSAQMSGRPVSTSTYDQLGYRLSTTDSDGEVTTCTYDITGRVLDQSVGGQRTDWVYDAAGRALSQKDPDGKSVLDRYDTYGRTLEETQTTSAGVIKDGTTSYDGLSRVATETDLRTGVTVTFAYPSPMTAGPTVSSLSCAGLTTAVRVDSAGNEISRVTTGAIAATYSVTATDTAGRITSWTVRGFGQSRSFDGAGRVSSQWGSGFTGSGTTTSYPYGADGRKQADHLPLVASAGGAIDTTYTYTLDGRVATATGFASGAFHYDAAGDVTTFTASTSTGTTTGVLAYGASSSQLATRYASNGTTLRETYGYNSVLGYRVSQKRSGETSATYTYWGQGGLKTYVKPANTQGVAPAITATYTYDATGQRLHSQVTSTTAGVISSTDTTWTYSGLSLLSLAASQSVSATGTWRISYLYNADGRPYAGVYQSNVTSATLFGMVTTDRGDVVALTDATGTPFASYRYDAWGRPVSLLTPGGGSVTSALAASIATRQPLRYAGYVYDTESGCYYLSARTYDPATMQFLQKDAARADGEESAYQYCDGEPVGSIDGSGLVDTKTYKRRLSLPVVWGNDACWAGVIASVLQYRGKSPTEHDVFTYAQGAGLTHQLYGQWAMLPWDVPKVLKHWSVKGQFVSCIVPWSATKKLIDGKPGQPIIACLVDWSLVHLEPTGHYVVIDGYLTVWDKQRKKRWYFYDYMDPYLPAQDTAVVENFVNADGGYTWDSGEHYSWWMSIIGIH